MTHEISNTDINYNAIMYIIEMFVNNLLQIIIKYLFYNIIHEISNTLQLCKLITLY